MNRLQFLFFVTLGFLNCKPTNTVSASTTLENTKWRLAEMNGIPIITADDAQEVHFILTSEKGKNTIQGFAGCNAISGSYTRTEANVKFTVASTMMMCDGAKMEIEDFITKALTAADSYKLNGEILQLFEGGTSLATFKAMKNK